MAGPLLFLDPRREPTFPDDLEPDEDGLVALGGCITPTGLLRSYRLGIFPWDGEHPIPWCSPDPRLVLLPDEFHLPRRMGRTLRSGRFRCTVDQRFGDVMRGCAQAPRRGEEGTWIRGDIIPAYTCLHELGHAHSIEVYNADGGDELVGGLYGVALGRCFFGESMFSREPNASKAALARLVDELRARDFHLIDCQQVTDHMMRLGARPIARSKFLQRLDAALADGLMAGSWKDG